VGSMPDPELQWIPNETAQANPVRRRAITAAVLAVSCVVIGIVIGRLTAGIPAGTGSGSPGVVSAPSAKKPAERDVQRPSLALKSDPEATTQKPAVSPSPQAEPRSNPPPAVLLNPGTADKSPSAAREETRARARPPVKERSLRGAPQENRERQATDDRRDMLSPPARDYQSLREYILSR
jgi:hypothetical protein